MPAERLLTHETSAADLVARVLQRSRHRVCVRHLRRPYRAHRLRAWRKYQNSSAWCWCARNRSAGVMAEVYGRLTRRPGVMIGQGPWVLGNGLIGTMEAFLSSSPMLLLTDFCDAPHVPSARALSAGDRRLRQLGRAARLRRRHQAGDAGARRRSPRCRRRSSRSSTRWPGSRVRWRCCSAIDSLAGNGRRRTRSRRCIRRAITCRPPPPPAEPRASPPPPRRCWRRRAPGDHRRQRRAHRAGLRAAARARRGARACRSRRPPPARAASPRPIRWRSACSARSAPRRRMPASARPTWCWSSAPSWAQRHGVGEPRAARSRRGRPSSRSTSSRATPPGPSRPSTC